MEALIVKSANLRERCLAEIKEEVNQLAWYYGQTPTIAFIAFGEIPIVQYRILSYVRAAKESGFRVITQIKMNDEKEADLVRSINQLNANPDIDTILILRPLPPCLNLFNLINSIYPGKEMEGLHPLRLMSSKLPEGVRRTFGLGLAEAFRMLISDQNIHFAPDAEWVALMDDEFIRNPILEMAMRNGILNFLTPASSFAIVNTGSANMSAHCQHADVLVVMTCKPEIVKAEWLKPGVFIVDLYGILTDEIYSETDTYSPLPVIRGGVDPDEVKQVASGIIPLRDGLHKMAPCLLLRNTVTAFRDKMEALYKDSARHAAARRFSNAIFAN